MHEQARQRSLLSNRHTLIRNKTMEKNIVLTYDERFTIILAIQDKIMNTKIAQSYSDFPMSEQTKRRLEEWEKLIVKLNKL